MVQNPDSVHNKSLCITRPANNDDPVAELTSGRDEAHVIDKTRRATQLPVPCNSGKHIWDGSKSRIDKPSSRIRWIISRRIKTVDGRMSAI